MAIMAGTGLLTGLLSSLPTPLPELRLDEPDILINAEAVPLHAGIAFGAGMAFMLWLWANRDLGKCLLAMALILAGWLVAVNTAHDTYLTLVGSELFGTTEGAKAKREVLGWLAGGMFGGAVGAGFTAFAASIPAQIVRRTRAWLLILAIGTLFGLLLYPAALYSAGVLLFVPWQAAVATGIAYALTEPRA